MNLQLKGKSVLISASTAGIGLATAIAFAGEGAKVVVNGRTESAVSKALQQIKAVHPDADLVELVTDLSTKEGADHAIRELNQVDVLVNNLGIYEPVGFFHETDQDWYRMFEVNIMSGVRLSRHFLSRMLDRNEGRVIFLSSETALNPDPSMAHYSATKAMLLSISRSLAELTKGTKVTVNSVLPGPTATEGLTKYIGEVHAGLPQHEAERKFIMENRSNSLIQRLIKPKEVAETIVFLCSSNAAAINGASLKVEGGTIRGI